MRKLKFIFEWCVIDFGDLVLISLFDFLYLPNVLHFRREQFVSILSMPLFAQIV